MTRLEMTLTALAIVLAISLAGSAAAENILRWAGSGAPFGFDPHSMTSSFDDTLKDPVYETLIAFDSDMTMSGHLATSWKPLNTTTWEFKLRENVRFHDGTPLTAADERIQHPSRPGGDVRRERHLGEDRCSRSRRSAHRTRHDQGAGGGAVVRSLLRPHHVESLGRTARRHAPGQSRQAGANLCPGPCQRHGALHSRAICKKDGGYVMVRNPDWWGYERYPHKIDRIVRLPVASTEQGVELLLNGDIDFLYGEPYDALERIERIQRTEGLKLARGPQFNVHRLGFDQSSAELRSSNIKGRNTFRDRRVCQAVYQAIDIETLVQEVHRGFAIPVGMPIAPGVNGYTPELAQRPPYDPGQARKLLAEAGYPQGFTVTLDCPNDWSRARGEALCQFIAPQLAAVGVDVMVNFQPTNQHWAKLGSRGTDFFMDGWIEGFD